MDLTNFSFFSSYFPLKLLSTNILYGVYILYCELTFIHNEFTKQFTSGKLVTYHIDTKHSTRLIHGNKY